MRGYKQSAKLETVQFQFSRLKPLIQKFKYMECICLFVTECSELSVWSSLVCMCVRFCVW